MELETPKENSSPAQTSPTPPSKSKKPSQPLYTTKQRPQSSKDKEVQPEGEVKPKPRPRYTDKARKNARNKKSQAGAAEETASGKGEHVGDAHNGDSNTNEIAEQLQDAGAQGQEQPQLTDVKADVNSWLDETCSQEENGEEESWDTLFNDDGDCLEPHLLEEVRYHKLHCKISKTHVSTGFILKRCLSACLQLSIQEGKKSIQEARFDYYSMDRDCGDDIDLRDDELSHIVEIYDFPTEFKTEDLLKLFHTNQYVRIMYG